MGKYTIDHFVVSQIFLIEFFIAGCLSCHCHLSRYIRDNDNLIKYFSGLFYSKHQILFILIQFTRMQPERE